MEARCTFAASPFSRTLPACRSLGEIASVFACKQKMMDAGGNDASPWSVLPPELMEMVWLFLPFPEMCFVNEVCRSWRNAISPNNERFWSLVHQSEFGGPKGPKSISWFDDLKAISKEYLNSYSSREIWAAKARHFNLVRKLFDELFFQDSDATQTEFLFELIAGGEFGLAQKFLASFPLAARRPFSHCPPVYAAARMGNLDLLRSMIEKYGAAPDCKWRRKWAYDIAAERGHIDILRYLHTVPDGDSRDSIGSSASVPLKTALFYAVRGGHLEVVRFLVEERHPLATGVREDRWNPSLMTLALAKQRWPVVEYLQSKGLKLRKKRVALEHAAVRGDFALATHIIDRLQHVRDPQKRWMKFRNPLRIAARQAQKSKGIFMFMFDRSGLHFDPITNPLQDKKLLIKAAEGNSVEVLQKLWDLGCRNMDDPRILSYIFQFFSRDAIEVVEWLIEHGVNPCVSVAMGYNRVPTNTINSAIESRMPDVAAKLVYAVNKWLLTHPPSELPLQPQPQQPHQYPMRKGKPELRMTQLNQLDEGRITPLQHAIQSGYTFVVEAFLANGIDIQHYPSAIQEALLHKQMAMFRFLAKVGAKPDENILRDVLESRCDSIDKLRAAKTLINRNLTQPAHLHTALAILGCSRLYRPGSTRLIKFLIKKGAWVSWTDLQLLTTSSTVMVEETALLEVLHACLAEDQKSAETLREDPVAYAEKKAYALQATILCAQKWEYWKLLKVAVRQEGVDLNWSKLPNEQSVLAHIIKGRSYARGSRRFYRGQGAKYSKAIHRLLKNGALVTWECFYYRDLDTEAAVLQKAFEAQVRGVSSIEDPQRRFNVENLTRKALSNLLCRAAYAGNIDRMQWVLSLAADVDPFKSIITSTWQGLQAIGAQLSQGDTVLIAAVKGGAPVAVFEWLLAHGADKAALDAKQHTAAFRAKVKNLSSGIQELLYTPGCDEEEESEDEDEDVCDLFGFED